MRLFAGSRGVYAWLLIAAAVLATAFVVDAAVTEWILARRTPEGEAFMRKVSKWGDAPTHLALGAIGFIVAYFTGNRRWALIFFAMLLACALAGIFHPTIKMLAGRSRPGVKTNIGWNGPTFEQKYQSFPSGHTVSTAAFFGGLLVARRRIGLALLPIPILIASSRLYLKAHHLSDVVFGAMLGFCCALLAWRILRVWFKSESPNELRAPT